MSRAERELRLGRRPVLASLAGWGLAGLLPAARAAAPAPDFDLPTVGGGRVQLAALRGKVVYLDFWASWCGPCRQSFPWMNELQARHGAQGLQVVAINVDARSADAERFLADVPARFTVALDPKGETPRRFAIKGMPTTLVIGADGQILATHSGFRPEDQAGLQAAVDQALAAARPGARP